MSLDVGTHLKAVRQMYGLSQRELAKRAGVTNGLISLIEQNRVSPSVSSLKKVLDGIPMALADFFTLDLGGKPQVFFPREELADIGTASVELRLVGGRLAKRSMSILHERYAPNADTGEEMLTHAGEEGGVDRQGQDRTDRRRRIAGARARAMPTTSRAPCRIGFATPGARNARSSARARRRPFRPAPKVASPKSSGSISTL